MPPPTPLQRLLAAANAPLSLIRLFFRRSDAGGDVYPVDAASGTAGHGPSRRLVIVGEPGEVSLGVLSHEMGNAGFVARGLAEQTGTSVQWSIVDVRSSRLRDARAAVVTHVDDLRDADAVVVLIGIVDTLSMTSTKKWERHLQATLAALRLRIPSSATIAVAEIPPLDNAGSLTGPARAVAGARSRAFNESTRRVVARHDSAIAVPFPTELTRQLWLPRSEEQKYLTTYEVWGAEISAAVATAIGQAR